MSHPKVQHIKEGLKFQPTRSPIGHIF